MTEEVYPINIWVNEERFEKLKEAGLDNLTTDVLAGMRTIQIPCTAEERDEILKKFPMAKFDSATTKTIELLPRDVKDKIFDLAVKKKTVNVISDFLKSC
ncbi:MAG: hypothetical protein DRG25_03465 [Deltaproteobacteria bacterium]|nr:MAG: hypothetical protein DRG25_03465 [Deltaproteobacteria bacterium]